MDKQTFENMRAGYKGNEVELKSLKCPFCQQQLQVKNLTYPEEVDHHAEMARGYAAIDHYLAVKTYRMKISLHCPLGCVEEMTILSDSIMERLMPKPEHGWFSRK